MEQLANWREKPYWQKVLPLAFRKRLSCFIEDIHPSQADRLNSLSWLTMERQAFPESPSVNVFVPEAHCTEPDALDFVIFIVQQADHVLDLLGYKPEEVGNLEVILDPSSEKFIGLRGDAFGTYHKGKKIILSKIGDYFEFLHEAAHWATLSPFIEKAPTSNLLIEGIAHYLASQIYLSTELKRSTYSQKHDYNKGSHLFALGFSSEDISLEMKTLPVVGKFFGAILFEIIHSRIDPSRKDFKKLGRLWKTFMKYESISAWLKGNGLDAKSIEEEWKRRIMTPEIKDPETTLRFLIRPLLARLPGISAKGRKALSSP